ncbi:hypothetical protein DCCM_1019 [Desulfocucumis palustris]|uniref:Serine protease n=1 Tax=Desulfocucumis palustris TaxID=1898651 RepID=A0A2L2XAY0_9FIRM|nr:hypothetical protein [Desulfocucumis palustris]GBF32823.1 hypothetical protein DCCM_1019 [Desulfocucumis palustris]
MEKIFRTLKKTRNTLLNKKNVIGVGVGYKQVGMERSKKPALIVFVEKKEDAEALPKDHLIPADVEGAVTDVIEIGPVRLLDIRTEKARPAKPGMSIGHYKITAGTFGAVVRDLKTGEKLILSNNHILANATNGSDGRSQIGDAIYQPGVFDGGKESDRIATLYKFIPLQRQSGESKCPVAAGIAGVGNALIRLVRPNYRMKLVKFYNTPNIIDAALARPVDPGLVEDDILEIGRVEGLKTVTIEDRVNKSGRSSGLSSGEVTALGVTLQVQLNDEEFGLFSDQVVCDMRSQGGDSGSLVLDDSRRAVGLLFAGSDNFTVFNHINNVLSALEAKI